MLDKSQQQLLELLKCGLWGGAVDQDLYGKGKVDWDDILSLSDEQTIMGLVSDAIAMLPIEKRPPKSLFFLFIKKAGEIQEANTLLYKTIPLIFGRIHQKGIKVLLLKGQGVGLCYRNPYLRTPGDVDLYVGFDDDNYKRANDLMNDIGAKKIREDPFKRHVEYVLNKISVEIHGEIKVNINKQVKKTFKSWMEECIKEEFVTKKTSSSEIICLPSYRFDSIFIFIHILTHYLNNGIGLRQVCDWACYLTKNHKKIDLELLLKDLDSLGLTKLWKIFAAMVVNRLGMKKELMPLYDSSYHEKGDKLLSHIFITGNFGLLQSNKEKKHNSVIIRMCIFTYERLSLYLDNLWLFPHETLFCFQQSVLRSFKKLYFKCLKKAKASHQETWEWWLWIRNYVDKW